MKITGIKNVNDKVKSTLAIMGTIALLSTCVSCRDNAVNVEETVPNITTTKPSITSMFMDEISDEKTIPYEYIENPEDDVLMYLDKLINNASLYGDITVYYVEDELCIKINSVKNYSKLSEKLNDINSLYCISRIECDSAIFENLNLDLNHISKIVLTSMNGVYYSNVDLSVYKTLDSVELINTSVKRLPKGISSLIITGLDKENIRDLNIEEEINSLYYSYGKLIYPGDPELEEYKDAGKNLECNINISINNADLSSTYLAVNHSKAMLVFDNCVLNNMVKPCCDEFGIKCSSCIGDLMLDEESIIRKLLEIQGNNIMLPNNVYCLNNGAVIYKNGDDITNSLKTANR